MHFFALLVAILAGVSLLVVGLLSVWQDLTERGHWDGPVVKDEESWNWSPRYRAAESSAPARSNGT